MVSKLVFPRTQVHYKGKFKWGFITKSRRSTKYLMPRSRQFEDRDHSAQIKEKNDFVFEETAIIKYHCCKQ